MVCLDSRRPLRQGVLGGSSEGGPEHRGVSLEPSREEGACLEAIPLEGGWGAGSLDRPRPRQQGEVSLDRVLEEEFWGVLDKLEGAFSKPLSVRIYT